MLVLPKNAVIKKVTFSLSNLSTTDLDDMDLITTIVTHCAQNMAKKHQRIEVFLHSHVETFKGYSLKEYTIQMLMPEGVPLPDSHQLNAVHNLRATLIQNAVTLTLCPTVQGAGGGGGGYVVEVSFYSHKNEFIVTRKLLTMIEIRELVPLASLMPPRLTLPPVEESGSNKRARTASKPAPMPSSSAVTTNV